MSTIGKRSRGNSSEISPPPLRRKTLGNNNPETTITSSPAVPSDPPSNLRIFSWNVNGVAPFLQTTITAFFQSQAPNTSYSLRTFLRRHSWPHILCLQEVKIALRDDRTQRALERSANAPAQNSLFVSSSDSGPGYKTYYCLPRDKYNAKGLQSNGKIYGVATFIRTDLLSSHAGTVTRSVLWDLEGRVLITELPSVKLCVVNGYWVNGTSNAYRSPQTGDVIGTRHDRKREFHALMMEECLAYEARGWKVCMIGDMNVARGPLDGVPGIRLGSEHVRNREDFNRRFFGGEGKGAFKGVDVWRHLYRQRRGYTYYGRGVEWGSSCDRVDLCIVSRACVEDEGPVVGMGILETKEERGHSDHVPLWVEFDLDRLK